MNTQQKQKWSLGMRVVVLKQMGKKDDKKLGYGVIDGEKTVDILGKKYNVPRIKMDKGSVLFGHECWWLSEEQYKDLVNYNNKLMSIFYNSFYEFVLYKQQQKNNKMINKKR
ncbi:MAG: hypothetical protein QXN16_03005 [Candidatus Micrarchaeaceae archaeon]